MYVFHQTGQLSIEEFYSPFGGKLDPNNRLVLLHKLIPWIQLESHYAPQFSAKTGAPAKPFQMAFGAVYIQQRLGVTDQETVELITESPYLQFFIGLSGYQPLPPFDASMMVHFRKRIGSELIKVCNAMTKANGIAMIQEMLATCEQEEGTAAEDHNQFTAICPHESSAKGAEFAGCPAPCNVSRGADRLRCAIHPGYAGVGVPGELHECSGRKLPEQGLRARRSQADIPQQNKHSKHNCQ